MSVGTPPYLSATRERSAPLTDVRVVAPHASERLGLCRGTSWLARRWLATGRKGSGTEQRLPTLSGRWCRGPLATEDHETDQEGGEGDPDEGEVVGKQVTRTFTDLVQAEDLVLDRAVVEVEAAQAHEDPTRQGSAAIPSQLRPPLQEDDQARDEQSRRNSVKDAVGNGPNRTRRPIVEVVPAEKLMQDDLVERPRDAGADQQTRQSGARPRDRRLPPLSAWPAHGDDYMSQRSSSIAQSPYEGGRIISPKG